MSDAIEKGLRRGPATGEVGQAMTGLLDRAAEEGLVDVAYTTTESPFGDLLVAATPRGLVRLGFLRTGDQDEMVDDLAARVSPRVLHAPRRLDDVRRQLDEYFEGHRRKFELRTDRVLIQGFARKVLAKTARIPYGSYLTYGELAAEAGSPRAHRAAGSALARNPIPIVIPCHRVLRSGGVIGNYGGGPEMKARLLEMEGRGR
ncbi:MAG: methylated-DNA-[protein]-cysteine S-methyltransferase [Thermoleophilaceae bacterium]|jgi:methylated-DNA-[protein]-cysteine S-methyltransferase|nr:methylated-DNA-[protein]-cysteine S-methyltransferase [Thermoleophilaceae bacterium]